MLRHCRGPFHAIVRSVRQQSHGNNSNNTTAGASHYVPPYTLEETFFALVISLGPTVCGSSKSITALSGSEGGGGRGPPSNQNENGGGGKRFCVVPAGIEGRAK